MLQVGIRIKFKQISSLINHIFLRSLTKAVASQQKHIVLALSFCRFLFEIAPNMLKGIANLTPMFWDLAGTVNHLLNQTHLHLFILQVLTNLIVNIARMTQNEILVPSLELLAKAMLVIIHN